MKLISKTEKSQMLKNLAQEANNKARCKGDYWDQCGDLLTELSEEIKIQSTPIDMILHCPECKERHIDIGEFSEKEHHTHACQNCGFVWRPAVISTRGVKFLPGFKNHD